MSKGMTSPMAVLKYRPRKPTKRHIVTAVFVDIESESDRSAMLHPKYPQDDLRRAALVAEEAGELIQAALDATRPDVVGPGLLHASNMYKEACETAVMAIRLMIALREEGRVS